MSDSPVVKRHLFMDVWLTMLGYAALAAGQRHRFCGIPPRLLGRREYARAMGFQNAGHMAREMAAQRKAAVEAGALLPVS